MSSKQSRQLTDAEKKVWFDEHLPHRIRVLLACSTTLNDVINDLFPDEHQSDRADKDFTTYVWKDRTQMTPRDHFVRRCETNAIGEGRLATLRWFIEFIGARDEFLKANYPNKSVNHFGDYRLTDLRPAARPTKPEQFGFLNQVWEACGKRVVHSGVAEPKTIPLDDEITARATKVIFEYLRDQLYDGDSAWLTPVLPKPHG